MVELVVSILELERNSINFLVVIVINLSFANSKTYAVNGQLAEKA